MPEVICNTSPLQYLHQIGHLGLLPRLVGRVIVPVAVVDELAVGRAAGVSLPDPTTLEWVVIQRPASEKALRLITDLGPGESEVLRLWNCPIQCSCLMMASPEASPKDRRLRRGARGSLYTCLRWTDEV